jgi:putative modified peptide
VASISIDLTPDQADEFLEHLATDDVFRRDLEADPSSALRKYGINVQGADLISGLKKAPDKSAIESLRDSVQPLSPGRVLFGDCFIYAAAVIAQTIVKPPTDA